MIKEMTLKSAMVKLSRLENELSNLSSQLRYKYKDDILSYNGETLDNSKEQKKLKNYMKILYLIYMIYIH